MRTPSKFTVACLLLVTTLFFASTANAQLLKKLQKKAEQTIERKLEQKTEKETEKAMDSILEPSEKPSKNDGSSQNEPSSETQKDGSSPGTNQNSGAETVSPNISDNLQVYSKYDFVPGDKSLFFDDFSQDFIGDFPAKWNTNSSGEVVKLNNAEGHWFEIKPGYNIYYIPDLIHLPEDYTIEFDVIAQGLDGQTSSTARMMVVLSDTDEFVAGNSHYVETSIPFGQYADFSIQINNFFNGEYGGINNSITADIRDEVLNQPHIAISVTKNRYRLWVNETKYVDVPRMITELGVLNHLKFNLYGFEDGEERIFISNLKVAEGGVDLRRKLLAEGKISTNGILFDSGSANIKPQSLGIVMQISQVLKQDEGIKLNIVGHTDSNGNDDTNIKLSKARAEAVKNALVSIYNISAERLQTDGKGESEPVADNATTDGKSQNRRVEFIKI